MLPLIIAATISAGGAPAIDQHPLDKASEGFVQCYEPDDAAKTCLSIAAYKANDDGTWDNTATLLISPKGPVTLETVTPVRLDGTAVCGSISSEDIYSGKLAISGTPVPSEKAGPMLEKIVAGMAPLLNRQICTTYLKSPNGLVAKGQIEGWTKDVPEQRVEWVLPSQGYRVASQAH